MGMKGDVARMAYAGSYRPSVLAVLLAVLAAGCATHSSQDAASGAAAAPAFSEGVAQALNNARAAIEEANRNRWIWRDTEDILDEAETAARKGDEVLAIKLANKARTQAELATNQYYLENAKFMLERAQGISDLTRAQKQTLAVVAATIRQGEGRKAYDLLRDLDDEIRIRPYSE